ncbi:MAG: prephenate dehydrogenase [Acidobacteriota bacterium]|nr:prephenate dehydrogenase [Acidobacteriota bacterium]
MGREALIGGLGLIGGSIGIALRRRGWRVRYVDPHVSFADAQQHEAADACDAALGDADVIILATPVDVAIAQLGELADVRGVVTSVCSVMQPLRDAARGRFVAGHPLAGSQEHGLAAANGDLFAGKRWFVDADDPVVDAVIADCGAVRERADATEHDQAVALTSHLPQVLSTALAAYLADRDLLRFAGSGLATFLRLAGSDAAVWSPILEANRANLTPHLEPLLALVREIVEGDATTAFAKANELSRTLTSK